MQTPGVQFVSLYRQVVLCSIMSLNVKCFALVTSFSFHRVLILNTIIDPLISFRPILNFHFFPQPPPRIRLSVYTFSGFTRAVYLVTVLDFAFSVLFSGSAVVT